MQEHGSQVIRWAGSLGSSCSATKHRLALTRSHLPRGVVRTYHQESEPCPRTGCSTRKAFRSPSSSRSSGQKNNAWLPLSVLAGQGGSVAHAEVLSTLEKSMIIDGKDTNARAVVTKPQSLLAPYLIPLSYPLQPGFRLSILSVTTRLDCMRWNVDAILA